MSDLELIRDAATEERRGASGALKVLVVLLVVLGLFVGAMFAIDGKTEVHLLNGTDLAVVVSVNGSEYELGPGARTAAWVWSSEAEIRTTAQDGSELEALTVRIEGDLNAYGVLGTAPLFVDRIFYVQQPLYGALSAPRSTSAGKEPDLELLLGESWVQRIRVERVFEPAPPTEFSDQAALMHKLASSFNGGWRTTLILMAWMQHPEADAFAERIAAAEVTGDDPVAFLQRARERIPRYDPDQLEHRLDRETVRAWLSEAKKLVREE